MLVRQAHWLNELLKGNDRLQNVVSDRTLDKVILNEALSGKY